MTVTIKLQNDKGETTASYIAKADQSIAQNTEGDIITSCGRGQCYVCSCKIIAGKELIDQNKLMPPAITPSPGEVLTCVAGIKDSAFTDGQDHEIILEKMI